MEPRQILKFLADVAVLASRQFGAAEPTPGPEATSSPPPAASPASELSWCELPSSTLESAIDLLQTPQVMKAALHDFRLALTVQVGARRKAERELVLAAEALAAERAESDRLRAELAELQHALAVAQNRGPAALANTVLASTGTHGAQAVPSRGRDIEAELEISFDQMVFGGTVPLAVEIDGESRTLDVTVPRGIVDGASLTLSGHGCAGEPPGDVVVRVRVRPNPMLSRDGNDIAMRVPVTLKSLKYKGFAVDTAEGPVKVPLSPELYGTTFRFEGKGIAPADQAAGDLLITLDASPLLDVSIDQFPSAATAFAALRSLSPPARAHLTTLAESARDSAAQREICEVLWALAVAHERGERGLLRGLSAQITADLMTRGLLAGSSNPRRRARVFAWLGGRSPLVAGERSIESPNLLWTVHLGRLSDGDYWTHVEMRGLVTHH